MLLVKVLKGTYMPEDTFEDGSKIMHLTSQADMDYYVDREFVDKCKIWDKEAFARLNTNVAFRTAYQHVYKENKMLTAVWLNSALANTEKVNKFDDIAEVLDFSVTHDKTKVFVTNTPHSESVVIEPLPDMDMFRTIEEPMSVEEVPTASEVTLQPIDIEFGDLEPVKSVEVEAPSFEPVTTDDIFTAVEPFANEEVEEFQYIQHTEYTEPPAEDFLGEVAEPVVNVDLYPNEKEINSLGEEIPNMESFEIEQVDDVQPQVVITQARVEATRDKLFVYQGEIPPELLEATLALIRNNVSFTIEKSDNTTVIEIN